MPKKQNHDQLTLFDDSLDVFSLGSALAAENILAFENTRLCPIDGTACNCDTVGSNEHLDCVKERLA